MNKWIQKILRIEPSISLAQWAYDTIAAIWPTLVAAFLAAGGMGHLASITEWSSQFGAIGIGFVALSSGLMTYLVLSLAKFYRMKSEEKKELVAAAEKWKTVVDNINPLDDEIIRKRFSIDDIVHPVTRKTSNKKLINCQIIGPGNIVFVQTKPESTLVSNVVFVNCDIVVIDPKKNPFNVFIFEDVHVVGGEICNMTIYIFPNFVEYFEKIQCHFITSKTI